MPRWNTKDLRRRRRHLRIRNKVAGTKDRPRLTVYRSLNHIYVQLVDDIERRTITSASTALKELQKSAASAKGKIDKSRLVGELIAERAKAAGIQRVTFDRGGYLYHGRVQALAEGARKGGLEF